ncbi:Peptidase family M28 [Novymonas esmeraldas]|uniref:BOS complex subunit NCLN n=1 Tax=Novymonas esmeraldas TaxID=1808958 RepID=A0AAW0F7P8_9TRYP
MFHRGVPAAAQLLLLLLSAMCLAQVALAGPVLELQVHRAIMFNRQLGNDDESLFGSRSVLLRGEVVPFTATGATASSYRGYTVYVACREHLSKSALQHLAAPGSSTAAKGMIVELCETDTANEESLALFFSTSAADIPVYFLAHGAASGGLARLLSSAAQHSATERVVLSVGKTLRLSEPVANVSLPSTTIEGQYVNKPKEVRKKSTAVPQVLVSAHFDTLGVSPASLTSGGASGAVAAMELWRRLTAATAAQQEAAAPHSVTVLLGSTSRFNYAGTTSWISKHTDAELDRLTAVLCLDELLPPRDAVATDAPELYLHVQDVLMKRPHGQQVVEQVEAAAAALGVSLKVMAAKTNYQHYDLRFEHEVFSSRQMTAMTLSAHRTHHVDQIFRDIRRPPLTTADAATLAKRADLVEAIVRVLAGAAPLASVTSPAWPGAVSYVQGQLQHAAESHRSPVSRSGADLRHYAATLEQHMRALAAPAQRSALASATTTATQQRLRIPGITLFGPYEETVLVYTAKSYLFEGVVAAASLAALLAFTYAEVGLKVFARMLTE